ncbi:acetoacetyl-CoA synthase [Bosea caraganae]|uniref:Acetoacetyl-CoA synthase n=1 Tax=Bosea caraganae TaxID=2763117 RepID=A0A370L1C4_9HYPH|nr:type II toxin-antitoxin system CcdA family antitoxin [Bosea caraganae]RDJ21318.1 acetoacetyl-CoA synthase [Bosea caraganae]RDJ26458.1 acetoacetyl-CoA synthase [Bosea caraganae]
MTSAAECALFIRMTWVSAKRPIDLSLDAELVEKARANGVNVSALTEEALRARIAKEEAQRRLEENREAIAVQNGWIVERGLFSDEFRGW